MFLETVTRVGLEIASVNKPGGQRFTVQT